MAELEVPMDLEEEERIWSAFKQASPTELTGGADALDKERASKFRKPEGKGYSKGPDVDTADDKAVEAARGSTDEDKQLIVSLSVRRGTAGIRFQLRI